jgi:hypothetical protein
MSAIPRKPPAKSGGTAQDFTALVDAVRRVHDECAAVVNRTVNTTLTLRNWIIGGYIHHYELHGADRAQYGERLMDRLADALRPHKIPATDRQRLYAYMRRSLIARLRLGSLWEPPGADLHAGWCGEGERKTPPYPIILLNIIF